MPFRVSQVLFLLHFVFLLAASHVECFDSDSLHFTDTEQDRFIKSHTEFSVVRPEKVDWGGQFISYSLSHHFTSGRHKRDLRPSEGRVYYKVNYKGRNLTLNLTINNNLVSNEYILERRSSNLNRTEQHISNGNYCHLIGTVTDSTVQGTAAVSTCKGLTGFLNLPEGPYVIEPVRGHTASTEEPHEPHVIYQSPAWTTLRHRRSTEAQDRHSPCGVKDGPAYSRLVEQEREKWEREQEQQEWERPHRISPRSISKERWVETMVVADSKLLDYHGSRNVESYIFTIMNMVAGIFHDASIGNAIHIILVRLILLHGEEKALEIVHHADTTLSSFCSWQKNLNPQSDTHPAHHDVAVLITRTDICAGMNKPCETLGLSHLSGMCQPHRSCNINEDSGLPVAFTIAHEIGHSFGIHHDGQGNDCELAGRHPFIMSRQLQYDSSPLTWSPCSKEYITRFLDRGWGFCLDDRPSKKDLTTLLVAPGVRYSTHHQCQLQYGPNATFCEEVDNMCQILWCSVNGTCRSKLDSPIDGTRCGPDKWCISGECVIVGKLPETVNGAWGQWSTWSHCSRTCGAGVQSAERECNQPKPEFGGKYCTGERKRYTICNTKTCVKKQPTFREMQCSEFDTVAYQNELYKWIPVSSSASPCELHCRPVDEEFSEKMLDAVTDGTPCFMNNNSKSICVNGVCKEVGCDFGIDSNAKEDRCGVCLGDGSSCQTVQETFDEGEGFGYVDMVLIPEGARDIFIQELKEAGNFLALKGKDTEDYYLNGNYVIQWNGEYEAGGATFYYERSGNLENLTSSGPTVEPVMIQLLFQEKNPGIRYEYTIKRTRQMGNDVLQPEYTWKEGAWTDCSTTCGLGEQHQPVRCFESEVGVVEEALCDLANRPDDRRRKCKNMDCPARWWVGGWQPCSVICGPEGWRKRTVLCVRTVAGEERVMHPGDCKQLLKPKPVVPCNRDVPCGSDWRVGNWSECSLSCGGGLRSRIVLCMAEPKGQCNNTVRPRATSFCNLQSCSSSHRRVGPPFRPRYRPPFPKVPTRRPVTQPSTPGHSTASVTPTTLPTTAAMTTTARAFPRLTTLDIFHEDDHDFILVRNTTVEDKSGISTSATPAGKTTKENNGADEEEGSTPDFQFPDTGSKSTPGYDYIIEDSTGGEGGVTQVNSLTTPAPHSTHSTPPHARVTTRQPLTTTTPHSSTAYWTTRPAYWTTGRTSKAPPKTPYVTPVTKWIPGPRSTQVPKTTPNRRSTQVPKTTPNRRSTQVPKTTPNPRSTQVVKTTPSSRSNSGKLGRITEAPHPTALTVKVLKFRKTSLAPRTTSRGKVPKGQQQPGAPVATTTSDYENQNARDPVQMDVFWVVGNWSKCSTTCGLGAIWRTVECSSAQAGDCTSIKKPEPARRCNLRHCATWQSGNWSKCPEGCVDSKKHRDVQCIDPQSKRPMRPFHCQALSYKPPSSLPCTTRPCLEWRHSPWGKCSKSCGEGLWERLVYCPEYHRCNATERPSSMEPCSEQPCTRWAWEAWEECSKSCGGGVQQRAVKCVNEDSGKEEKRALCEKSTKPDSSQTCSPQECKFNMGPWCRKNSMSTRFCEKLKLLGRCSLRSIRKQCCVTCMA